MIAVSKPDKAAFPKKRRAPHPNVSLDRMCVEPYRRRGYSKRWREIAERADIPREVWNMDGRASGVTEARDAGAQKSGVSRHAAHAGEETTRRIYDRASGVAVTGRVQDLRVAKRARSSK